MFIAWVGFSIIGTAYAQTTNQEEQAMKTVIHRADTRGHANHGWLDTHHTFSFANYHNPDRIHFGALRVLNDDWVDGGRGFGTHPHDNMEIISIPLVGDLEHKDSMGNTMVIKQNDVQVMSAGTGVFHSEYNKNQGEKVNFLQIWVFPKEKNIKPRYEQKTYLPEDRVNRIQRIVSPEEDDAVWINQDAYFSLSNPEKGKSLEYTVNTPGNGVYVFVVEGAVSVNGAELNKRDGMGVYATDRFTFEATEDSEVLLMEVPLMNWD